MNRYPKLRALALCIVLIVFCSLLSSVAVSKYQDFYAKSQEYIIPVYNTSFYYFDMSRSALGAYVNLHPDIPTEQLFFSTELEKIKEDREAFKSVSGMTYGEYKDKLIHGQSFPSDVGYASKSISSRMEAIEDITEEIQAEAEYIRDHYDHGYQAVGIYAEDKATGRIFSNFDNAENRVSDYSLLLEEFPYIALVDYDENGSYTLEIITESQDGPSFEKAAYRAVEAGGPILNRYYSAGNSFEPQSGFQTAVKNTRFLLMVPQTALTAYSSMRNEGALAQAGMPLYIIILAAIAAAAGFAAGLFTNTGSGPLKRHIPAELWILADVLTVSGIGVYISIASATLSGDLAGFLGERLLLEAETAVTLSYALNRLMYAAVFAVIFCSFMCFSRVFRLGIADFIRKYSLIAWALDCLYRTAKKVLGFLTDIRPDGTDERKLFILLGINLFMNTCLCFFWVYALPVLILLNGALAVFIIRKYRALAEEYYAVTDIAEQMTEGRLDVPDAEAEGVFSQLISRLTDVKKGFRTAVEKEVRSQSMKTELITNVSHDLKTPLTAIITYADLLKNPQLTEEERQKYIETLNIKSARLKSLIEDLFEVSKASSRDAVPDLQELDLCALINQTRIELDDKLRESGVDFRFNLPSEKVRVMLDGARTSRIFENLLINISKYSLRGSRAYIDLETEEGRARVTLKNISASELKTDGIDFTERFVRGDASRSTEGSGLGLAIAKSFTELQGGTFDLSCDGDLFKVSVSWPLLSGDDEPEENNIVKSSESKN